MPFIKVVKDSSNENTQVGELLEVTWFGYNTGFVKDYYPYDETVEDTKKYILDIENLKPTNQEEFYNHVLVANATMPRSGDRDDVVVPISAEVVTYIQKNNGIEIISRSNPIYLGKKEEQTEENENAVVSYEDINVRFAVPAQESVVYDLQKERKLLNKKVLRPTKEYLEELYKQ